MTNVVIPPPLTVAVAAVTPLVRQFQQLTAPGELEVRLGSIDANGAWSTGIAKSEFLDIVAMLNKYRGWDATTPETHQFDYFYTTATGITVRTTVALDSTAVNITHITKQRCGMVELTVASPHPHHARVVLKTETPVDASTLPDVVMPHLVRLKQRQSFRRGAWRFDVSRVWTGTSRSEAERARATETGTYEVEVEFVPSANYWDTHTAAYAATSLLMKVSDVLSGELVSMDVWSADMLD